LIASSQNISAFAATLTATSSKLEDIIEKEDFCKHVIGA
jgi:hypothetical protein